MPRFTIFKRRCGAERTITWLEINTL
jgi:hypothetical protein